MTIADLRNDVETFVHGSAAFRCALDQLCALAARAADPAPVADEAAIETWRKKVTHLRGDAPMLPPSEFFVIMPSEIDEAVRLMRRPARDDGRMREAIARIEADMMLEDAGTALLPRPDDERRANRAYNQACRNHASILRGLLAESPAGDAPCQTMNSSSAADADKSLPSQSPMGPQEMTHTSRSEIISGQSAPTVSTMETLRSEIRGLHVVLGKISQSLKMSGWTVPQDVVDRVRGLMAQNEQYRWMDKKLIADLNGDIDDLRARLQAAEAERDLANETLESMTKERDKLAADLAAAKADRSIRDAEADGRRIQDLTAQLAAAQKERDEARSETAYLDNILEGIEHALGDRMKGEHSRAKARHIEALLADLAAAKADRDAFREKLNTHIEARQNCKHILVGESAVQAVERLAKERDWERHEWPKQIAAALESQAKPEAAKPVCKMCNDTHSMDLEERSVPCTHCPTPCQDCRAGAYCKATPCGCSCHTKPEAAAATDAEREGDDVLSRWLALDKSLTQLEWLASMLVVVDELCRRALEGKP